MAKSADSNSEPSHLSMGTTVLPKNLSKRYVFREKVLKAFFSASFNLPFLKRISVHSNKKSGKPASSGKFFLNQLRYRSPPDQSSSWIYSPGGTYRSPPPS